MKAFGNFVVETNDGDGWVIQEDNDTGQALVTRKRAREIKAAYESLLKYAEKPYRVRVVNAGQQNDR